MQRTDSSVSSLNLEDETEDMPVSAKEMKYSAILDISFSSRAYNYLLLYSAKVNGSIGVTSILGTIFACFTIIQIILPAVLINSINLWPPDNILTLIFQMFAVFFDGPPFERKTERVVMAFVLVFIYLFALIIVVIRSFIFSYDRVMSRAEAFLSVLFFKYLFIFFLPHLFTGIPIVYYDFLVADYNLIDICVAILVPIIGIIYFFYYFFFFKASALLENSPLHEWITIFPIRELLCSLCPMLASCVGLINNRYVILMFPIITGIFYIIGGICTFIYSPFIKQQFSLIFATSEITAGIISFIQMLNLIYLMLKPMFVLVAIFVVFIFVYIILFQIYRHRVITILRICDECFDFPERSTAIFDKNFKSSSKFLYRIIPAIDQWHPYFTTWKLFDNAILRFPDFHILLLYARLLSFFPPMNTTMLWVSSMIAKVHHPLSHTYYIQFRQISQMRQRSTSYPLRKKIDEIKGRMDILCSLMRRFWENILQKNTTNFWTEVDKITHRIKTLNLTIIQLTDDYPNSIDVQHLYYQFVSQIKHNFLEARNTSQKIWLIEKYGYQKADAAMSVALIIFPNIEPYLHDFQEHNINANYGTESLDAETAKSDNSNSENMAQIELAMQELTAHSKLGRVWPSLLLCIFMTCIVIVIFFIFETIYKNEFIVKQGKIIQFISSFGLFRYRVSQLNFLVILYPLFLSDRLYVTETTMYTLSPNVYSRCHLVPFWYFNGTVIQNMVESTKYEMGKMISNLYQLADDNHVSRRIKEDLILNKIYNGMTFESSMSQLFQDCNDLVLVKTVDDYFYTTQGTRTTEFFLFVHDYLEDIHDLLMSYSYEDFQDSSIKLDILLVVVVILALALVTIPFIFQVFKLQTENAAISDSFAYFPNTEIRDIINKFGMSSHKREDDSTYIAQVTQGTNIHNSNYFKLFMTFFATFVPLTICCIVMHFMSSYFINDAKSLSLKVWTLYEPFTLFYISMVSVVKVAVSDILDYGSKYRDENVYLIGSTIVKAEQYISDGIWGKIGTVNMYFEDNNSNIPYFKECFNKNTMPPVMSLFEGFAIYDFPVATDFTCGYLKCLSNKLLIEEFHRDDYDMISLFYYFADFFENFRGSFYFKTINTETNNTVKGYLTEQNIITGITIAFQCVACLLLVLLLLSKHAEIKNALRFFHDISPISVTQNQHAMLLLDTGIIQNDKRKSSFSSAEKIISRIPHGIVLIDRQLVITDINDAFLKLIKHEDEITRVPLTDIIYRADDDDRSWPDFIQHVSDAFIGRQSPQFTDNVTVKLSDKSIVHLLCNAISLAADRPAVEGEHESIEKIAIVIIDCTKEVKKRAKIENEQQRTMKMISNVIPQQVITELINGENSLSFVSQSVTIGEIQIKYSKQFDYKSADIISFLYKLSSKIDSVLEEFELLNKVRTCGYRYIFAGGLFSRMIKPDRHADQAVRFALKAIEKILSMAIELESELVVRVGIHTAGPVVAGIMSVNRPTFQIIGPVMDMANQLASLSIPNQVHITRAVYELVFSSGFRVHERGETIMRTGSVIPTYLVSPQ
ncbi:hypothetical protein TRFO_22593 [Tritrichomonas foetus]|uniref:Guanylate cyclase domain-containing protein n=1 Tax=Tritrichomonas foetus TaxID=1144522 RepID=A0A1J4KBP4_9EUKA|nr:hypothetical protein TRFO_22593 [Tritrichomonas foetus]|eukprot:OHT08831.1 hypothetical protein TRFO_22593 [Tritrichomonas foetus]